MILITDQFPLDGLKYVLMGLEECQVHACARFFLYMVCSLMSVCVHVAIFVCVYIH